ncbi:hypothetical protein D910_11744, partial [Dendroctonus ponderosae]
MPVHVKKPPFSNSSLRLKMTTEDNGNIGGILKPTSSSNEDLSEYTDADESISAPTEFLAEFLSAVMLKDYLTALKYCKLILQYEPNNATAKEFYPLILEKLKQNISLANGNGEEGSSNESEDEESEGNSPSASESAKEEEEIEQGVGDKGSKGSSEGDGTTGSYSSLEDDEAESDQLSALVAKYQTDNVNFGNGNKICKFLALETQPISFPIYGQLKPDIQTVEKLSSVIGLQKMEHSTQLPIKTKAPPEI